jgi:hypothetical protein
MDVRPVINDIWPPLRHAALRIMRRRPNAKQIVANTLRFLGLNGRQPLNVRESFRVLLHFQMRLSERGKDARHKTGVEGLQPGFRRRDE